MSRGGRWKVEGPHPSPPYATWNASLQSASELKPALSPRILTAQLRELERDEVIVRKVYPVVPPKVEYSLSPAGESLRGLIQAMQKWGDGFLIRINAPVRKKVH